MKKEYILFIDSGIGGISTLEEVIHNLNANFLYYADNIHSPYGNHHKRKIYIYLKNIIEKLSLKYYLKTVVLACNTATTTSIKQLRNTFKDIKFIGTEPAISLAYKKGFKNILCIATPTTIQQNSYKKLKKSLNIKINDLPLKNFAMKIEEYLFFPSLKTKLNLLKNIFYIKSKSKNIDSIVLGCTHYVLVKDIIQKYINTPLIHGNYGVMQNLKQNISIPLSNQSKVKFIISSNDKHLNQKYIKILKQILAKY